MTLRGLLTDRQKLIAELERETGRKAFYSGAPLFRYSIGPYTILREGQIQIADEDADIFLLQRLAEMGLIERVSVPRGIAMDTGKFTGRTLTNLVNMIAGKEQLINRVVGEQAFHMKGSFVEALRKTAPNTANDFMDILNACGGEAAMKGVCFTGRKLIFTGFPEKEEFRVLAERMVETALSSKWVKAKAMTVVNEKYSFRVWLNTLGMKGKEYARVRESLLKDLKGDPNFRMPEQREAFEKARREKQKKTRQTINQVEFVAL